MDRAALAKEYFEAGHNCAQSVVLAFSDLIDADRETLVRASIGLGGGVGRLREVCGTVTGAAMCLGLLFPEASKSEVYALVQEHAKAFSAECGSIVCRELLSGAGVRTDSAPEAEVRTAGYYKKRPCAELCAFSARLLEEILSRRGRGSL